MLWIFKEHQHSSLDKLHWLFLLQNLNQNFVVSSKSQGFSEVYTRCLSLTYDRHQEAEEETEIHRSRRWSPQQREPREWRTPSSWWNVCENLVKISMLGPDRMRGTRNLVHFIPDIWLKTHAPPCAVPVVWICSRSRNSWQGKNHI